MTDVESRLRRTLSDRLDPIAPDARRAPAAFRRARRGRVVRGAAAGLACALVVAVAAAAWERRDDRVTRPAGNVPQSATYSLSFDDGTEGTITIDVQKAQACVDLPRGTGAVSAHLHRDPAGVDPTVAELYVAEARGWPVCGAMHPDDAEGAVRDPRRHYVELHPPGPAIVAELEPLDLVPQDAPAVAEIACSQDGAVALTPQVRPREDGVHLKFYNPTRRWRAFNLLHDGRGNEGGRLSMGTDANVSTFPPGPLYVSCLERQNDAVFNSRDDTYARFTIVDPDGLWTEPDLDCDVERERPVVVTDEPLPEDPDRLPDFEALIREHVPGLEPADELERPGYPGTEFHFEPRTVVRGGRRVAGVMLVQEDGFWAIDVRACPGSGL